MLKRQVVFLKATKKNIAFDVWPSFKRREYFHRWSDNGKKIFWGARWNNIKIIRNAIGIRRINWKFLGLGFKRIYASCII